MLWLPACRMLAFRVNAKESKLEAFALTRGGRLDGRPVRDTVRKHADTSTVMHRHHALIDVIRNKDSTLKSTKTPQMLIANHLMQKRLRFRAEIPDAGTAKSG